MGAATEKKGSSAGAFVLLWVFALTGYIIFLVGFASLIDEDVITEKGKFAGFYWFAITGAMSLALLLVAFFTATKRGVFRFILGLFLVSLCCAGHPLGYGAGRVSWEDYENRCDDLERLKDLAFDSDGEATDEEKEIADDNERLFCVDTPLVMAGSLVYVLFGFALLLVVAKTPKRPHEYAVRYRRSAVFGLLGAIVSFSYIVIFGAFADYITYVDDRNEDPIPGDLPLELSSDEADYEVRFYGAFFLFVVAAFFGTILSFLVQKNVNWHTKAILPLFLLTVSLVCLGHIIGYGGSVVTPSDVYTDSCEEIDELRDSCEVGECTSSDNDACTNCDDLTDHYRARCVDIPLMMFAGIVFLLFTIPMMIKLLYRSTGDEIYTPDENFEMADAGGDRTAPAVLVDQFGRVVSKV